MSDFADLIITSKDEINTTSWNNLVNCVKDISEDIPKKRWAFNDLIIDNNEVSTALHLRNDNHGGSYITNRNNFVENGTTENTGLFISAANDITIQTGDWDEQSIAKEEWRKNFGIDRIYIAKDGQINLGYDTQKIKLYLEGDFHLRARNNSVFHSFRGDSDFDLIQDDNSEKRTLSIHGGKKGFNVLEVWGKRQHQNGHSIGLTVANNTANVGIGTRTPDRAKLQVEGEFFFYKKNTSIFHSTREDSDFDFIQSDSSELRALTIHAGLKGKEVFQIWSRHKQHGHIPALTIANHTGDVGIGNTAPQAKLHVSGDLKVDGGIRFPNGSVQHHAVIFRSGLVDMGSKKDRGDKYLISEYIQITGFKHPPTVICSIAFLDSHEDKNLTLEIKPINVTATSFRIQVWSWADTILYGCRISWLAIGS